MADRARIAFRKPDVRRAIDAVRAAGLNVVAVEFTAAGFLVRTSDEAPATNPLDQWRRTHAAH